MFKLQNMFNVYLIELTILNERLRPGIIDQCYYKYVIYIYMYIYKVIFI